MMRKKVFFRYLFSYILVLTIPITIISYFIYFQFIYEFQEEVMGSATKVLQQTRDATDSHLKGFSHLTSNLAMNPHISYLLSQDNVGTVSTYPYYSNAIKELNKYKNANPVIENIFMIFKEQDVVISDLSKYDFKTFNKYVFKLDNSGSERLMDLLNTLNGESVLSFNNVIYNARKTDMICYMHILPINGIMPKAILMVTINQKMLKQTMENFLYKYRGYTYVFDDDNDIIMTTEFADFILDEAERDDLLSGVENQGEHSFSISKNGYVISFVKSNKNNWRYVSIIPSSNILSKVNNIQQRMVEIIVLTLLIGILIILYFSGNDYSRIQKIINSIKYYDQDYAVNSDGYRNEWELINKTIVNYVVKNQDLHKKIYRQMPVMKNSFFNRLINGNINDENSVVEMLQFLGLDLKKQYYGVLIIETDINIAGNANYITGSSDDSVKNKPIRGVIQTALTNIIQNVIDREAFIYALEDQKHNAVDVIIGINDMQVTDNVQYLQGIAYKIKDIVKRDLGLTVTIGIGGLYNNLLELSDSYNEASQALEYKIVMGCNSVISYDEICSRSDKRICYSFRQEKDLINFIRMGAFDEIQKVLDEIVYTIKNKPVSLNSVKYIYFDIINTAMKAADEIDIESTNMETFMEELTNMETLDQIYNSVSEFYKRLCIQIRDTKLSKNIQLANNVMKYIDNKYMDSALSVGGIAEHFSVSASYLSRYMKNYLGYSITEYIHEVRLQRAKSLLKNTDRTIAEIADEVGYNSLHNFSRVFKRYEGITPTDFRV